MAQFYKDFKKAKNFFFAICMLLYVCMRLKTKKMNRKANPFTSTPKKILINSTIANNVSKKRLIFTSPIIKILSLSISSISPIIDSPNGDLEV